MACIVAVIPARGGSTGLRGKNLKRVQGISLVGRAAIIAARIPGLALTLVSTDDPLIAEEARRFGADAPFLRPPELSGAEVPMADVLRHVVQWCRSDESPGLGIDGLLVLQPTCPMRKVSHVRDAVQLFLDSLAEGRHFSGVMTVSPVPRDRFPDRFFRFPHGTEEEDDSSPGLWHAHGGHHVAAASLYRRDGAAVLLRPDHIAALNSLDPPLLPCVMSEPLVSIDTIEDLLRVEHCGRALQPCVGELHGE